MTVINVK